MVDLVSRDEWGFEGPLGPAQMEMPSRGAWLHHSVTTPTDDPYSDARTLEEIGQDRFGRLSYSYLVHPSGVVLEGQGDWIGAHTHRQNSTSHGIVCIGNYEATPAPEELVWAVSGLLRHGHRQGWWASRALLGGHRDAPDASTACPGQHLYALRGEINRRALHGRFPMQTLLYVRRGTEDRLAALAGAGANPRSQVAVTTNLADAKAALADGLRVYAVGGLAAKDLPKARALVGSNGADTLRLVAAQAAKGW